MKRTILLLSTLIGLATLASAATVACTVNPSSTIQPVTASSFIVAGGSTGGTVAGALTCPTIDAGQGNVVTSLLVQGFGDYTAAGEVGVPSVTLFMTFTVENGLDAGATGMDTTTRDNTDGSDHHNPALPFAIGSTINPNVQIVNSFTVSANSALDVGSAIPASSSGSVMIEYTVATVVPEPPTMVLMGVALVGLGVVRKPSRKAAQ